MAQSRGYPAALSITAIAYLLAAVFWLAIPETKNRTLS